MKPFSFYFLLYLLMFTISAQAQETVNLYVNSSPQVEFATAKIEEALKNRGYPVQKEQLKGKKSPANPWNIILTTISGQNSSIKIPDLNKLDKELQNEGFAIRMVRNNDQQNCFVVAKDPAGLMYGGLELAELIRTSDLKSIEDDLQNPYMNMRGTKFNIPLDVRTPSYSDVSDAAQHNIEEMWSLSFWKEYIDSLASYRYNFISLWSLHPFPSLVKVPEYPSIALADVHRSTTNWKENYSLEGKGFDDPEIVENYEVLKKMTIEEKIAFWREVMRYGKDRNVNFYFITWNIFTNGTFGKYGITDDINNETTRDYFRQSVKQMFLTYPDLAGIGLTTGENMSEASFKEKEDWAYATYAQGVLDAATLLPDRKITFIHRQHMAGALDIADQFAPLVEHPNINFIFSFKYAKAHVYSSTNQVFHQGFVKDIQSRGELKTIWTLRNDDIYYLRWGAPDFVREFIKNIPYGVSEGYYYGSDQYVWGREFMEEYPVGGRQIEIAKHWYHWMIWGRLGYNPDLSNERFVQVLQAHYPQVDAGKLFEAWQSASMIYPLTTGFHWGSLDFQWYIEAGQSRQGPAQTPSGYHDINRFITLSPHPGTDFISIPEFVKMKNTGTEMQGTTPFELAGQLQNQADQALQITSNLKPNGNRELFRTLEDIKAMAYLGKYYAHKIDAATNLALFRENYDQQFHQKMITQLNKSALNWRYYASTALGYNHNPLWTNRVGYVDWRELYQYALYDITAQGGELNLENMEPTANGKILEAEQGVDADQVNSNIEGFTGSGYVKPYTEVGWTYNAAAPGTYIFEFRYQQPRDERQEAEVKINQQNAGEILFWPSGAKNWVWDRMEVKLPQGESEISLEVPRGILLDHLNIIKL